MPVRYSKPHFYGDWNLSALKTLVLRLRNIIPVCLMSCALTFRKRILLSCEIREPLASRSVHQILMFLNTLPAVQVLHVTLNGNSICVYRDNWQAGLGFEDRRLALGYRKPPEVHVYLPSVRHLSTTAIGLGNETSDFWRSIMAQNMISWTVGFDVPSDGSRSTYYGPLEERIDDIFCHMSSYPKLNELNFFIYRGFGRKDNTVLARLCDANLEHFSVTYPDGEQRFFGQADADYSRCTTQLRSVHLKNCKGMIK